MDKKGDIKILFLYEPICIPIGNTDRAYYSAFSAEIIDIGDKFNKYKLIAAFDSDIQYKYNLSENVILNLKPNGVNMYYQVHDAPEKDLLN